VTGRVEERGDAHEGMGQCRVGEEVAGDGRRLEGKRQFTDEVRRTTHRENRAVRQSER
jgi:hypothetical protein